ncbi:LPS export ABC transporter periplasmic protein LptC [Simiduia aestuariiviva]|uniref:Lipopolysaccharide export system protein LptC n=1 Tax=Simiduia aestuariiviva TaxID=1510459 RepID=A0A839UMT1_9GAMM|nr:LPS export ABC transporter periplasmic protein LptC [Simiduia aestuariiviva]MBB3169152.1 lipopolysaccharide export system protein LptC [Simiduia aestuariiviva]
MALVKKILPAIVALIVIAYLFIFETPSTRLFDKPSDQATQKAPAFFMTDFVSSQYDENGRLSQQLRGLRADHFQPKGKASAKDYTLVQQLKADIYNPDQAPWHIVADKGRATHRGDRIELTGNVHLFQKDPVKGVTELFTNKLIYFTKRQVAQTNAPVKIVTPQGVTTAKGLKANIKTEQFTLTKKVKGIYEPD